MLSVLITKNKTQINPSCSVTPPEVLSRTPCKPASLVYQVCAQSLRHVQLSVTPWTAALRSPVDGISQARYWSGYHILLQGVDFNHFTKHKVCSEHCRD